MRMSSNSNESFSITINVNGKQEGNNYAAKTMNFGQPNNMNQVSQLISHLKNLEDLIQDPTFPLQGREELSLLIRDAKHNLHTEKPDRVFVDKLLDGANKYNSFFSGGQLLTSIAQLTNDLFGS